MQNFRVEVEESIKVEHYFMNSAPRGKKYFQMKRSL